MLLLAFAPLASGYSVLTHEAVIDAAWKDGMRSVLLARFPDATPDDLRRAHGYAYGGSILADMGYYPFGSKFFSDLLHYVRSGDFVTALMRDAQDLDEYAFALGALAHYVSDSTGHPLAVNLSVPIEYAKLRAKYGNAMTYEDNPVAHIKVEFGFDVVEVAEGNYAPQSYHDFIGFEISQRLLESAFRETYGMDLKDVFFDEDLAIGTYRYAVSKLVPRATKVAWQVRRGEIQHASPGITRKQFLYNLSRSSFEKNWGKVYEKPGPLSKFLAFLFRLIPKFGPFRTLDFRPPTAQTEQLFMASFNATMDDYRRLLQQIAQGGPNLPDRDLDTGAITAFGEYRLADRTYAKLVEKLAANDFRMTNEGARTNILVFYGGPGKLSAPRKHKKDRRKLLQAIQRLQAFEASDPANAVAH